MNMHSFDETKDLITKQLREKIAERKPQRVWERWIFVVAIIGAIVLFIVKSQVFR